MPAILTHDLFGREIYDELYETIGGSKDEFDSFLLGCQGPDVLFFSQLNPAHASSINAATKMHRADPAQLILAFARAAKKLPGETSQIGKSYLLGFLCHYVLDSRLHPFIYAQQYAISDAGVDGLDRTHGHEIHAEIESELDVLVLSTKREATIADYSPEDNTLRASKRATQVISYLYKAALAQEPIRKNIPENAFSSGLALWRLALAALYSPTGIKRTIFGAVERLFRDHSFMQAMSHRNELLFESDFDNRAHDIWIDPWLEKARSDSFWDIYNTSLDEAKSLITKLDFSDLDACEKILEEATGGLDFNGCPTRAVLIGVQDL